MNKSIFYFKQLTATEVGNKGTHEIYIRMPNDFDSNEFFQSELDNNNGVLEKRFKVKNLTKGHEADELISLRFAYFEQSNKEKRIPSLGDLFKANNVNENDVVKLESRIENGIPFYYITFLKSNEIQINPKSFCYSVINDQSNAEQENRNIDLTNKNFQQIFYGAPGTGKSHKIKERLQGVPTENIFRTTFHPDSDYSTFVGAYKPTMKRQYRYEGKVKATYYEDDDLAGSKKGEPVIEKVIEYSFVPQVFLNAYIRAYQTDENVYLIIEEINRGNCAQIFGDLFQLLDRDANGVSEYAIKADADLRAFVEEALGADSPGIKGGELSLPSNLYIWATMNTSDQSLFPIDSAFKRRWDWEYEPISYKNAGWRIAIGGNEYSWTSFQREVNKRIFDATHSEDKMLGDYFVNPADGVISADLLRNKVLFYLWNDVCKDGEGDIFRTSETDEIQFSDLYGKDGSRKLLAMMDYLHVETFGKSLPDDENRAEGDSETPTE